MNQIILETKNLSCGYDTFNLSEINLKVKKGDFIGIIGPNGSGKTTILRAITKILKIKDGEILFNGKSIWQMGYKELARKVAVVSQDPEVNFISIEDFVLLGRIPHFGKFQFLETKRDLEVVEKCMSLTGITKLRNKFLGEISGGEKQLAFIARALCQEPQLILLDEPTTFLDITHQVGILDLIKRLNKETGLTVLMIMHDLNLASEYCNQLILMNKGRIHKIGTPEEVLTYKIIEEVYQTVVVVEKSPISSRPYVFLVSESNRERAKP